jgi:hypothetical protein
MADEPEILTTTEARGGVTPHIVRYMLLAGLILAVAGIAWAYLRSPTQPPPAVSSPNV